MPVYNYTNNDAYHVDIAFNNKQKVAIVENLETIVAEQNPVPTAIDMNNFSWIFQIVNNFEKNIADGLNVNKDISNYLVQLVDELKQMILKFCVDFAKRIIDQQTKKIDQAAKAIQGKTHKPSTKSEKKVNVAVEAVKKENDAKPSCQKKPSFTERTNHLTLKSQKDSTVVNNTSQAAECEKETNSLTSEESLALLRKKAVDKRLCEEFNCTEYEYQRFGDKAFWPEISLHDSENDTSIFQQETFLEVDCGKQRSSCIERKECYPIPSRNNLSLPAEVNNISLSDLCVVDSPLPIVQSRNIVV